MTAGGEPVDISDAGDKGCGGKKTDTWNGLKPVDDIVVQCQDTELLFHGLDPAFEYGDGGAAIGKNGSESRGNITVWILDQLQYGWDD